MLLARGINFILDALQSKIDNLTSSGLYVGLITDNYITPETTSITEVTGISYTRQVSTNWNKTDDYLEGDMISFTPGTSGWLDVNGYFISDDETNLTPLWSQMLPLTERGDKEEGHVIYITPRYYQRAHDYNN